MNFDRLAPHYRCLETFVFGDQLQKARVAFVREIGVPRRVLIVGEGDGRFLDALVREHPGASVDCVEASAPMIALARRSAGEQVNFIQTDIRYLTLSAGQYDLIVTHFFLDCFVCSTLQDVIEKLARAAAPGASWLLADFREPAGGWRRWHARLWIRSMYRFFNLTTGIDARQLVDPSVPLMTAGFERTGHRLWRFGLISSERWRRLA